MPSWRTVATDILSRLNGYKGNNYVPDSANNYMVLDLFDSIEFDGQHLWFCKLSNAPGPFDKWFPAQTCTEPTKGLSVSSQSFGIQEVHTLNSYNAQKLAVEFIDDDKATLEQYIANWQKNCSADDYDGFKYIPDILETLQITKYDWQKSRVYIHEYYVIPTDSITVEHSNDPALKTLRVNFASFGSNELS